MPRVSRTSPPDARARAVFRRLRAEYPDARCSLTFSSPWELLVATILSAQCTDDRVNMVTPGLFARFPSPEAFAGATQAEVEEAIRSTGFFRNKARSLIGAARSVLHDHGGEVPRTMDQLKRVPGAGRKTANVVLGNAYGIAEGIAVDTHASRLSVRLGLTDTVEPVKAERELMALLPRRMWTDWTHLLIAHGRAVCTARKAHCDRCVIADLCPSAVREPRRSARPARARTG
ncbi:MAG: putative glycosylase/AP lyase [Actinomycetota bacterium]|jgi:endonuclease-3